jgi:hypothetical protein
MAFMQRQITRPTYWLRVDDQNGTTVYPADDFSPEQIAEMHGVDFGDVETVRGIGARLSAPGYLDCTDWALFGTVAEAEAYLSEMYGEDEDEDAS